MAIVSKCSQCARTYTARVATCQICGGTCVPVTPEDSATAPVPPPVVARPAPPPPAHPVCPCCGGDPGPRSLAVESRRLLHRSFFSGKKKYLITTITVPGVCAACWRAIQKKRYLADVLCLVPLVVVFGWLVGTESKLALGLLVIYVVHLARRLTYTWVDSLLYGAGLRDTLAKYAPPEDPGRPRFPAGSWHGAIRLGILPAGLALLIFALPSRADRKAAQSAPNAPAATVPPLTLARTLLQAGHALAVPVNRETVLQPALGGPAITLLPVAGQTLKVVQVYTVEAAVPRDVPYELMNGPTLLANFLAGAGDGLSFADRDVFVTRAQIATLVSEISGPKAPPSAIKRRR